MLRRMQPESLSKAIQLSVAPVFLLAGIGALMNVLSGRYGSSMHAAPRRLLDAGGDGGCGGTFHPRKRAQLISSRCGRLRY